MELPGTSQNDRSDIIPQILTLDGNGRNATAKRNQLTFADKISRFAIAVRNNVIFCTDETIKKASFAAVSVDIASDPGPRLLDLAMKSAKPATPLKSVQTASTPKRPIQPPLLNPSPSAKRKKKVDENC